MHQSTNSSLPNEYGMFLWVVMEKDEEKWKELLKGKLNWLFDIFNLFYRCSRPTWKTTDFLIYVPLGKYFLGSATKLTQQSDH